MTNPNFSEANMKRFFVMVLLVSTFFIGLGALVDGAKASLKSDARALELIRLSRIAIGGEANINNVRSMTITANTTNYFDNNGAVATETGSLELAMQLPNQFSKMVRIGNPDENVPEGAVRKRVEVRIVTDGDGKVLTENVIGEPNQVIEMKKGDGTMTDDKGNAIKIDGDSKIIMKKHDGTIQEIKPGDKNVIIMKRGDGNANWTSKDGNKTVVDKDVRIENHSGNRHNEMLRTTLSLLLTAPEGTDVAYTYAGEGTVDGNACNIVLAQSGGSSFKLFLDKSTFLPRMISYDSEMPHIIRIIKDGTGNVEKEMTVKVDTAMSEGKSVEHQLKFSDFRTVGGLLLPHRWAESAGGKQSQTVEVTAFEINPANIADRFKGEKVYIRKSQ
jgi:hypothetical protein